MDGPSRCISQPTQATRATYPGYLGLLYLPCCAMPRSGIGCMKHCMLIAVEARMSKVAALPQAYMHGHERLGSYVTNNAHVICYISAILVAVQVTTTKLYISMHSFMTRHALYYKESTSTGAHAPQLSMLMTSAHEVYLRKLPFTKVPVCSTTLTTLRISSWQPCWHRGTGQAPACAYLAWVAQSLRYSASQL